MTIQEVINALEEFKSMGESTPVKIVLSNLCVNSELDIFTIVRNDRNTVEIVADI